MLAPRINSHPSRKVVDMRRLIGLVAAVLAVVNGIGILTADNCKSISFDGEAGGRVMAAVCYPDSQGALPAWLAGLGLILLGIVVGLIALAPRRGF